LLLRTIFGLFKAYSNKAKRMNFGKYKGKSINWLINYQYSYCTWLVNTGNTHTLVQFMKKEIRDRLLQTITND